MKQFLVLSFLALTNVFQAQNKAKFLELGNVVSDSNSVNKDLGAKLGLQSITGSKNSVEIRLYANIGFPTAQCVVLQYDKTWKATKIKLNAKDSVIKTNLKPSVSMDGIVKSMIASNVFSLPSQRNLNTGSYKLDLSTNEVKPTLMIISDASCYTIQFKVGDQLREYKYCDPKQYGTFYKGQHEFIDFAAILKSFAKLEVK